MPSPKLRSGSVKEPYPIGKFPDGFVHTVAGEISVLLAVGISDIEGKMWEQIFAKAIGAKWTPSVMGLDDILVQELSAAWGAKSVKNNNPFRVETIRLISGRNSLDYSFAVSDVRKLPPDELGAMVIEIWNERVAMLHKKYKTLRTVVLIKGPGLGKITVFEKPTERFYAEKYDWSWNSRKNLVGHDSKGAMKFTWQPHGSQFTIVESVPEDALRIEIAPQKNISAKIMETIGFNKTHYRVVAKPPPAAKRPRKKKLR
jgi:hypothetical protein